MTRIFLAVAAVLLLGLSVTGGLLYRQIGKTAEATEASQAWQKAAQQAEGEAVAARGREDALNTSMKVLAGKKLASDLLAAERESEINNLKKTEGDTNETISCLDQRVPAELSRVLNAD